MADDYSNDSNTTGLIAVGGSSTGNFEAIPDSDWFKVALSAGVTYLFTLEGDGAKPLSNYLSSSLALYGSQGSVGYGSAREGHGPVMQYTASVSGTYYVAAGSGYFMGGYRIKLNMPVADDYAAGTSTTGVITAGKAGSGVFERTDDVDWFRFHADAGQITTFVAASGDGLVTPSSFDIYDSAGRPVTALQAQAGFVAGLGGDYFVAVRGGGELGKYAVSMNVVSDDYSADNAHPGSLVAGGQASGTLEYRNDVDRFQLAVQAGQFYTVSLSAKPSDALMLTLGITDGAGGAVASTSSFSNGTLTLRVLATGTGTYWLNVAGGYSNDATGTAYTLKASAPEADDFGGTMGTAAALTLGAKVAGKIQAPDDIDMFKVNLTAGVTYRIEPTLDSTAYNYGFRMTDSGGNVISQSAYLMQKFFTFTPTQSGTFYLSQTGNSAATQAYSLTVSAAVDDFSANTGTSGRLTVGASALGEIEAGGGDADWYAVALDAGGYYWFSVDGAREAGGTLGNYSSGATMRLLDASGAVLATSVAGYAATSNILPYVPAAKGIYYLEVASTGVGTYTVKAQPGEADDHGNDAAHATAITAATAVNGRLQLIGDADVFKFTAEAGVTYQLQLTPGAVGGLDVGSYVMLDVSTGSNEFIATRSLYGSSGQLTRLFEASKGGDYYVKVATSTYGTPGSYVLSVVSQGKDDFSANKSTTAVAAPGKPLQGNIGVVDDRDWVKVHLEAGRTYVMDLQGAPSGGGTLDTSASGMTLYNGNGLSVAYTDVSVGSEPRMYFIARATGDYYLDVHGTGSNTGSYSVVVTVTNGDLAAPHLLSASVPDGAVGISPVKPTLVLTFDELVMVDGNPTLTDNNGVAVIPPNYNPLVSAVGNTLVIDPRLNLKPGVTYTLTLPEGSVLDLAGNKLAGALSYKFTVAAPVTAGTSGDDFMLGSGSGLMLDGGAGLDTVYMSSTSNYNVAVTHNADGSYSVRDYSQGGSDTLIGVERLLFSSGAIALDTDGVGGQAYRLYQAAFNRTPDSKGLGYWISAMDHGASLTSVADSFVHSQEFLNLYGATTSDADFVNLLYKNVLHRAPDAGGSSYWLAQLGHDTSRAQVLAFFGESNENIDAVAKIIGNGFQYTPYG